MAKTPETSEHSSIQKRTEAIQKINVSLISYCPLSATQTIHAKSIAFSLQDYCELVDTTGRIIRAGKAGVIDSAHSSILNRLGLSEE